MTRDQPSGSPTTENEASGMGGPARKARPAPHPYVQVAVLVLAAVVAWKLAGVLLLLFSAILLAAALSAMSDGLRRLAPLPSQVTVLLAALLMFGVLASVIALFGWRILAQYEEILSKARDSAHALLAYARAQPWGDALLIQANGARISDATDTLVPILGSVVGGAARYFRG